MRTFKQKDTTLDTGNSRTAIYSWPGDTSSPSYPFLCISFGCSWGQDIKPNRFLVCTGKAIFCDLPKYFYSNDAIRLSVIHGIFFFKAEIVFCLSFGNMYMKILKSFICGCQHFLFGLLEVLKCMVIQRQNLE